MPNNANSNAVGKNKKLAYERNKAAKTGENIKCPVCGREFLKRQYSQAFCCRMCKDSFWNSGGDRHKAGYYKKYDAAHPDRRTVTERMRAAVRMCEGQGYDFFGDINRWSDVKAFLNKYFDRAYDSWLCSTGDEFLGDDECESFRCEVDYDDDYFD